MNIFEVIYRWFGSFFGGDMADYLSGYVCPSDVTDGGYLGENEFLMYGFIALGIAFAVMFIYYYAVNHPRFNRWWSWAIMLLFVGFANLFIGAFGTLGDLWAGNIEDCLVNGSNGGIGTATCWLFGLANLVISMVFFIILSFVFKWGSRNCKYSPF
jgi:hypothetical protein